MHQLETATTQEVLSETWHNMVDLSVNLSDEVEKHFLETGEKLDGIVVFPRGGYLTAGILAYRLGFSATQMFHMCLTSYKDGEKVAGNEFMYGQLPEPKDIEGLNLLAVDEVCDSGRTMKHGLELLQLAGAKNVWSAVTHYKPDKSTTGYVPDFYVSKTGAWIKYPWDVYEGRGKSPIVNKRQRAVELVSAMI